MQCIFIAYLSDPILDHHLLTLNKAILHASSEDLNLDHTVVECFGMSVDYLFWDSLSRKSLKIAATILPKQTTEQKKQEYGDGSQSTASANWSSSGCLLAGDRVSPYPRSCLEIVAFLHRRRLGSSEFTLHYEGKQCQLSPLTHLPSPSSRTVHSCF